MTIRSRSLPALTLIAGLGLGLAAPAPACESEADGRRAGRRGPPPEAYAACADRAQGDACTVTTRRGDELTGECGLRNDEIFCMPEGGPPRGRRGGFGEEVEDL